MNYCPYCGKKLKEGQDVCLKCGKVLNKNIHTSCSHRKCEVKVNTKDLYYNISSILVFSIAMVMLYASLILTFVYENAFIGIVIPSFLSLIGAALSIRGKDKILFIYIASVLYFISGMLSMLSFNMLTEPGILLIAFGIMHIVFTFKE